MNVWLPIKNLFFLQIDLLEMLNIVFQLITVIFKIWISAFSQMINSINLAKIVSISSYFINSLSKWIKHGLEVMHVHLGVADAQVVVWLQQNVIMPD